MRVIRVLVYVGLVALLLPSPPPSALQPAAAVNDTMVPPQDMFLAAVNAVDDLSSFCSRQPGVCETAHAVVAKLEAKAKYSFRLMYEWAQSPSALEPSALEPPLGPRAKADPMPTGSVTLVAAATGSQSTLTLEDLIPEWRGPKERRPG
jgi:hypothetical protein